MKHLKVIATLVVVLCLWVGYNSAFADELVWQTSLDEAVSLAKSQGKKILLIGGDKDCAVTQYMKSGASESVSPPIKSLIERYFIPWYSERSDLGIYFTQWSYYAKGIVGSFNLPLICVIDPNDSGNFLDRTTGKQDLQVFYSRLLQYGSLLYFPHVNTSLPWQTEIAIINTSNQTVTGTLRALNDDGQLVEAKPVSLSAHGRREIAVATEFTNHTNIGYIIYEADSDAVQGYTKFYQKGVYRTAIPAVTVKEVNTDIYIPHITSDAQWSTEVILVNTTSDPKELNITFNTGQSVPYTLKANEHKVFTIASLFNNQPPPDIQSAVITKASGIIGLELFGSNGDSNQQDGILLTDKTASTVYYPHVAGDEWWTGIVAYNPSEQTRKITITPYTADGNPLSPKTLPNIQRKGKYVGTVADLGLPAQTAWFRMDSDSTLRPFIGFELFGTVDGNQLAAYAGGGDVGAKAGVFPKIEKDGWTGIAFVNTEATAASVTLIAYNDSGHPVATRALPVGGHAKVVNFAEELFLQDVSGATYIAYSSDRNVVGFQLNGSSDGMMLDGLPGLAGTN